MNTGVFIVAVTIILTIMTMVTSMMMVLIMIRAISKLAITMTVIILTCRQSGSTLS